MNGISRMGNDFLILDTYTYDAIFTIYKYTLSSLRLSLYARTGVELQE